MTYKSSQKLLIGILSSFFIISIAIKEHSNKYTYPFFSWSLFSEIPIVVEDYTLIVYEKNGKPLTQPLVLQNNPDLILTKTRDVLFYFQLIRELGRAIESKNDEKKQHFKAELEYYLLDKQITYEIVRIQLDPHKLWNDSTIPMRADSLARF